jgi:hypothetical protein
MTKKIKQRTTKIKSVKDMTTATDSELRDWIDQMEGAKM